MFLQIEALIFIKLQDLKNICTAFFQKLIIKELNIDRSCIGMPQRLIL